MRQGGRGWTERSEPNPGFRSFLAPTPATPEIWRRTELKVPLGKPGLLKIQADKFFFVAKEQLAAGYRWHRPALSFENSHSRDFFVVLG